jgi:hypothetical protein
MKKPLGERGLRVMASPAFQDDEERRKRNTVDGFYQYQPVG